MKLRLRRDEDGIHVTLDEGDNFTIPFEVIPLLSETWRDAYLLDTDTLIEPADDPTPSTVEQPTEPAANTEQPDPAEEGEVGASAGTPYSGSIPGDDPVEPR